MDDRTDDAINRIEKRIIASRDPVPCDDFQPVSAQVQTLCAYCGHYEKRHHVPFEERKDGTRD